jgi:hypothetical protein
MVTMSLSEYSAIHLHSEIPLLYVSLAILMVQLFEVMLKHSSALVEES